MVVSRRASFVLTWFLPWFRLVPNLGHAGAKRWKVYASLRKTKEKLGPGGLVPALVQVGSYRGPVAKLMVSRRASFVLTWFLPWFKLVPNGGHAAAKRWRVHVSLRSLSLRDSSKYCSRLSL